MMRFILALFVLIILQDSANAQGATIMECWMCGVAETYMRGGLDLGEAVFVYVVGSFQTLLGVILALFILLEVAKLFYPFGPMERSGKALNSMATRIAVVMIIALVALSPRVYLDYIFYPILTLGTNFSVLLLEASNAFGSDGSNQAVREATVCIGNPPERRDKIINSISCQMYLIQKTIVTGMDLVNKTIGAKTSKKDEGFSFNPLKWFANIVYKWFEIIPEAIAVMFVNIIFGFALLRFPIQALDLVFRWVIVTILSPMMIAAFAFPKVRFLAVMGVKALGHSALTLAFMSAIAGLIAFIMIEAMADVLTEMGAQNVERTIDGINAAIKEGGFTKGFGLETPAYWQMLFLGLAIGYLFKQAGRFAAMFIDSRIDDINGDIWERLVSLTTVVVNTTLNVVTLGNAQMVTLAISAIAKRVK